jgi:putative photosynthetic complex assembly protein
MAPINLMSKPVQRRIYASPLAWMVAVMVLSIGFAAVGGFGLGAIDRPAHTVAAVQLSFADRSDGAVDVIDARTGHVLQRVKPGEGGFLRATMRGLANERKRRDISDDLRFALERTQDGHVLLSDPATGRLVALDAFGQTNRAAFERFLDDRKLAAALPNTSQGERP